MNASRQELLQGVCRHWPPGMNRIKNTCMQFCSAASLASWLNRTFGRDQPAWMGIWSPGPIAQASAAAVLPGHRYWRTGASPRTGNHSAICSDGEDRGATTSPPRWVEAPPPPLEVGRPAAGCRCRGCPMPNCRFTVEEGAPWIPWEWRAPPAGEGSDRHAVAVSGVVERLQQRISKACFSGQIGRRTKQVFSWPVEGKRKIWGLNQRMHALVRRGPPESKPIPIL